MNSGSPDDRTDQAEPVTITMSRGAATFLATVSEFLNDAKYLPEHDHARALETSAWLEEIAAAAAQARVLEGQHEGEPTAQQLADSADGVVIQREDLVERMGRIRAAAESDPDLSPALRDFLLTEASAGCLHVTPEMLDRQRSTGTHRASPEPEGEGCPRCGEGVFCRCPG